MVACTYYAGPLDDGGLVITTDRRDGCEPVVQNYRPLIQPDLDAALPVCICFPRPCVFRRGSQFLSGFPRLGHAFFKLAF
jgi:hypothetical protein